MTKAYAIWTGAKAALLVCAVAATAALSWSHIAVAGWQPVDAVQGFVEGN